MLAVRGLWCHCQLRGTPALPERRLGGVWAEPVTAMCMGRERLHRAGVQGDLSGLAELGLPDPQHTPGEIDVVAVEPESLPDAKAADRQEPDRGLQGGRPQRGAELAGGGHERGDFGVGVQVGRRPMSPAQEQSCRGHLVGGIEGMEVTIEDPNHREPLWPPVRAGASRQARSGEGVRPTDGEVALELGAQVAHDAASGQGKARVRSRSRSTLAEMAVVSQARVAENLADLRTTLTISKSGW